MPRTNTHSHARRAFLFGRSRSRLHHSAHVGGAAVAAAAAGLANRWGGAPIVADPAGAFGVGYVSAALVDLVGRGVLTAPQSHPNESFVFKRLRGATPNRSYNRFSRTPPTQNRRAAAANRRAPNCRFQEFATLSPFSRRRGGRKAHHNAATRGFPTPPRPFNP